jgi:predicted Zn-dependent protease
MGAFSMLQYVGEKQMMRSTVILLLCLCFALPSYAGISIVRDDEIESVILQIAAPVFKVAGPIAKHVRLHYVADASLNAFTGGGMDMVLHTGLILACETPGMLRGVIAHELAHIVHGHVAKTRIQHQDAQMNNLAAMIVGAGAVLAGAGGAGMALALGGMHMNERALLAYSRLHERQADQTAMEYLQDSHLSSADMLQFMTKLDQQSRAQHKLPNSYAVTHPLTHERMSQIRHHVEHEPAVMKAEDPALIEAYRRARIKLASYVVPIKQANKLHPSACVGDTSTDVCYQNTILLWRMHQKETSLGNANMLIAREPNNPYFHELKGQILFGFGESAEAIIHYQKAKNLAPKSSLIRAELATVYLEEKTIASFQTAIALLREANRLHPNDLDTLYLLAIAYGKANDLGASYHYLAEWALEQGQKEEARRHATHAKQYLKAGTALFKKNQDVLVMVEKEEGARR